MGYVGAYISALPLGQYPVRVLPDRGPTHLKQHVQNATTWPKRYAGKCSSEVAQKRRRAKTKNGVAPTARKRQCAGTRPEHGGELLPHAHSRAETGEGPGKIRSGAKDIDYKGNAVA